MEELHLTDLAADFEHYLSELSARCTSVKRATVRNPFDGRETPDLFTLLAEPWSDNEGEEFLDLVKLEEQPNS